MAGPRDETQRQAAQNALAAGDLARAASICDGLVRRNRKDFIALAILGQVAMARGNLDAAASHMQQCTALRPKEPGPHLLLGEIHKARGEHDEAIARFDRVLRLQPDNDTALAGKAEAYEKSGRHDLARALIAPSIETGRESPGMAMMQARLDLREGNHESVIALVGRHLSAGEARGNLQWHLSLLMGRALEQAGRHDEAFAAYRRGNEAVAVSFDPDAWRRSTDEIIETFSSQRFSRLPRATNGSPVPVFIVGMPRCGSTLVETIIDAHPAAHGAGELPTLHDLAGSLAFDIGSFLLYPQCVADLDQDDVDALGQRYLDHLVPLAADAKRIVDKLPANYLRVGLIAVMLPEARIIHCRRHPLDTCFSCYLHPFEPALHPYSTRLGDLGAVYADYERLMTHWRDALGIPMLEVQYETLVKDQERVTREIIDFCGLDWDDRCLRFHEQRRVVQTASYEQVTKPIYTTSVERYKNFENHLGPLIDALRVARPSER